MPRLTIAAILTICVAFAAQFGAQEPTRVLLISIDGLMPSSYTQPAPPSAPTLRRLAAEGAAADGVIGVTPTVTYPSHTTMITGVVPAVHGVVDNRMLDPENRSAGAWYWYARQIRVPTLIGAARASGLRTAAINWPVTIGSDAQYLVPEFERSRHPEARYLLDAISTPDLLASTEITRGMPLPWPLDDEGRADITRHVLRTYQPHLTMVHLLAVDGAQHDHGPGSPEGVRSVERADAQVARILGTIDEAGLRRGTVVAVVSDHGFLAYDRVLHPNVVLKQEGLLTVNGRGAITDWQAYFHSSGGSGYIFLRNPKDAALRQRVSAVLDRLKAKPEAGVETIWDASALARAGAHPDAAFGIDVRNGWYTGSGHDVLVTRTEGTRGGHGYAPERRELHASLVLNGPGIGRGKLGIVRMTQIAPTLARLLGIALAPQADQPIDLPR
jgi:predicted AlkP superfamily pyrophosphatase or phosphodiesterase